MFSGKVPLSNWTMIGLSMLLLETSDHRMLDSLGERRLLKPVRTAVGQFAVTVNISYSFCLLVATILCVTIGPTNASERPLPASVTANPIVYVVRHQYASDHHNTATLFQTGEINERKFHGGSAIRTIDLASGETTTLLDVPNGVARDLEVSFDGSRILFSMRRDSNDDYHLYEMEADGSDLRQLTFGLGISDIDPIYLPDDRILFTSTREPKYCMCNRHIMCNLVHHGR